MVCNGECIPFTKSGNALIIRKNKINLQQVLVPKILKKLISISKLTQDLNCFVKDMENNKTLLTRIEENGLYKIQSNKKMYASFS